MPCSSMAEIRPCTLASWGASRSFRVEPRLAKASRICSCSSCSPCCASVLSASARLTAALSSCVNRIYGLGFILNQTPTN